MYEFIVLQVYIISGGKDMCLYLYVYIACV